MKIPDCQNKFRDTALFLIFSQAMLNENGYSRIFY